jgi:acyl-CoA thioester hydrolase
MPEFVRTLQVTPADLDEAKHLGNATYLKIAEDTARAHALEAGFDYDRFVQTGVLPIVHRHTITYKRRVLQGPLEIRTHIQRWQGFRCMRQTTFWQNNTLMAELESEWIWVDAERFRPKIPTSDVRDALFEHPKPNPKLVPT